MAEILNIVLWFHDVMDLVLNEVTESLKMEPIQMRGREPPLLAVDVSDATYTRASPFTARYCHHP